MNNDYDTLDAETQRILRSLDRAAGDLRRGQGLFVFDSKGRFESTKGAQSIESSTTGLLIFSLDHADSSQLNAIMSGENGKGQLLLTAMRAFRLGLASDTDGSDISVTMPPSASLDWARFVALANWDDRSPPSTAAECYMSALARASAALCMPSTPMK